MSEDSVSIDWGADSASPDSSNDSSHGFRRLSTKRPRIKSQGGLSRRTQDDNSSDGGFFNNDDDDDDDDLSNLQDSDSDLCFEPTTVPSLHSTRLGSAVAELNIQEVERLLRDDEDAMLLDERSNNLLHLIARPAKKSRGTDLHGSWQETLGATNQIVALLVKEGVNINGNNLDGLPPLLTTIGLDMHLMIHRNGEFTDMPWAEGHAIVALIEAGADVTEPRESPHGIHSILDLWIITSPVITRHPEAYDTVTKFLVERVPNLQPRTMLSPIEKLRQARMNDHTIPFERTLKILTSPNNAAYAKIDYANEAGDTPLFALLSSILPPAIAGTSAAEKLAATMQLAKAFLSAGASLDFISPKQKTVIEAASCSNWRTDEEDVDLMRSLLIFEPHINEAGHSKLINNTRTHVLAHSACLGRYRTVKFLLTHGMGDRISEAMTCATTFQRETTYFTGSILDMAFFGAQCACKRVLSDMIFRAQLNDGFFWEKDQWSRESSWETVTDDDLETTDSAGSEHELQEPLEAMDKAKPALDMDSVYKSLPMVFHEEDERRRELGESQYWGYGKLQSLLRGLGVERVATKDPRHEPTYFDATVLPRTRFSVEDLPRRDHWSFLYELEILGDDWEDIAVRELADTYNKSETWPRPAVLKRWPSLPDKLTFSRGKEEEELFFRAWHSKTTK
ncbi:hypothetical protein B0J13DRAFT_567933 [Dactylonectria estremocensis]|uniref:Ankyrin n=1 Tax=Dactylonectria estremocensis TaxID=1079267 RepID=A0A9P9II58_9HYPO|nr:hypothetical protein B0J13DRAFT_567933 [Dactylonectria estremocensis]